MVPHEPSTGSMHLPPARRIGPGAPVMARNLIHVLNGHCFILTIEAVSGVRDAVARRDWWRMEMVILIGVL